VLVDGRNLFDPEAAWRAGLEYCAIGRAAGKKTLAATDRPGA
jgi:hypothetical protein